LVESKNSWRILQEKENNKEVEELPYVQKSQSCHF